MAKVDIFSKAPEHGYREVAKPVDAEAFKTIVENRRSVRVYDDSPIPEAVMKECLRLAFLAPNSSNLQTWQFYWVRSAEKKQHLIHYCLDQPAAKFAQELVVAVARPDFWKTNNAMMLAKFDEAKMQRLGAAYQYYRKIVPLANDMGPLGIYGPIKTLAVWLRGLRQPTPRGPFSRSGMAMVALKSTALACENYMLAMTAQGFDTCPMEGMDSVRIKQLLDLPRAAKICMVISAGKRANNGVYGPRVRFDSARFVKEV